jgi:hypothetical protein
MGNFGYKHCARIAALAVLLCLPREFQRCHGADTFVRIFQASQYKSRVPAKLCAKLQKLAELLDMVKAPFFTASFCRKVGMAKQYSYNPRKETRFNHPGLVLLYSGKGEPLEASGRDLSLFGIGIELPYRLESYKLGAEVELEFAEPNHLRGLKIRVQLKRVHTDSNGHDHCGFAIVDGSQMVKKRVGEIISFYEKMPSRFIGD